MATSLSPLIAALFLLLFALPSHSSLIANRPTFTNSKTMSVWNQLEYNGLPRGLLPDSVTRYTLDEDSRRFEVTLPKECQIQFNRLITYDTNITGTLNFGSIKDLTGVHASFGWFLSADVTAIEADIGHGQVEFKVGILTETYPASDYEVVRSCEKSVTSLREVFVQVE